ncbi:limbic system-associated membrane protein-like [Anneissia japonica]|uniref:limbic system-associated membrane protein-like n=1 Tax=Anneissia japonica TaxID=1529436 RepID=UPI00142596CC|nr:limbic system-associated membrane protein-like [Anneissia japonica]
MRVILYLYIISIFIPVVVQSLEVTTDGKEEFAEGSEALLTCKYTPTDALGVDITWTRANASDNIQNLVVRNIVQDEYKARMELEVSSNFQGKAGLRIFKVRREDAMFYYCDIFRENDNSPTKVTTLDVQWNYKPKITSDASKQTLQVGDNVTATCIPNGHPTPVVSWLMDNQTIQIDERFTINENTSSLHIAGVTREDHALLSCSTQNAVNVLTSDQIELDIQYEPKVYLNQSDNFIQCVSQANPVAYLTEFQIDDAEPEKSSNGVYELTGSECVNITCFVTNTMGIGNASDIVCPFYIPPTYQPSTGLGGGAIAGIVIGCLVLVGAVVILVLILLVQHKSGTYEEPKKSKWEFAQDNDDMYENQKPSSTGAGAGTDTGSDAGKTTIKLNTEEIFYCCIC